MHKCISMFDDPNKCAIINNDIFEIFAKRTVVRIRFHLNILVVQCLGSSNGIIGLEFQFSKAMK